MSLKTLRTTTCYAFTWIVFTHVASGDTLFRDTFDDRDAEDGNPATWVTERGTWDASTGDLVASGTIVRIAGVREYDSLADTSVRAQVRGEGNAGIGLGVRRRQGPFGYAGFIEVDGTLSITRVDGAPVANTLGSFVVPFNAVEQDVILQLDAIGTELSLWAWPFGEAMPAAPQLVVVDSMYPTGGPGALSTGIGDTSATATFRFVHVADAHIPTSPTAMDGDFNSDGILAIDDLDVLRAAIQASSIETIFDVNHSGTVNVQDLSYWIRDLKRTWLGDANLDGEFNSADLVEVFVAGQYDDGIAMNSSWSTGDWNADGDFTSGDLVVAFQDGGYDMGPRQPIETVPEPVNLAMIALAMIGVLIMRRPRRWPVCVS